MILLKYLSESCPITNALNFLKNIPMIRITTLKGYKPKAQNVPQKIRYHTLFQSNPDGYKTFFSKKVTPIYLELSNKNRLTYLEKTYSHLEPIMK